MTTRSTSAAAEVADLLPGVERLAREAGSRLLARYSPDARLTDRASLVAGLEGNESVSAAFLREGLEALHPASWLPDEDDAEVDIRGDWWVVDPVEGNINALHGLPEWAVSVSLVRDGVPLLAVVYEPVPDRLHSAVAGRGSFVDGRRLRVSATPTLETAIAVTGQAEAEQTDTYERIGASITAMLRRALLVRAAVPSTFPLLLVASGQNDVFWQYRAQLAGVAAGVLLATEAGATVSRIDGTPWGPGAPDVLVAAPQLHAAAVDALRNAE